MSGDDEDDVGYLYHVTTASRLPGIAAAGLRPGRSSFIGGASARKHRTRGVFLTEADGVRFWFGRAEVWAQDGSDDLYEDKLIPVVLRVPDDEDLLGELDTDELGSADAGAEALITSSEIDADAIEVFTPRGWRALEDVTSTDLGNLVTLDSDFERELLEALQVVDHDDEGEPIRDFKTPNPFLPEDDNL